MLPDCVEHGADKILMGTINAIDAQAAQVGVPSSDWFRVQG